MRRRHANLFIVISFAFVAWSGSQCHALVFREPSYDVNVSSKLKPSRSQSRLRSGSARVARQVGQPQGGVVHFLFMVKNGLAHPEVWRRFFAKAPQGAWQAYVHCSDEEECTGNGSKLFQELAFRQVPRVPSAYCVDLVTPIVQLMKYALSESVAAPNTTEKFVVVSDSTLPVKPFSIVHKALTSYPESDFCITPAEEWRSALIDGVKSYLVKHSQWIVLNREHASKLVQEWIPPTNRVWHLERNTDRGWWTVPLPGDTHDDNKRNVSAIRFTSHSKWSCTDEHATFAKIFGPLKAGDTDTKDVPGLGRIAHRGPLSQGAQGRCHTFVVFQYSRSLGNLTRFVEREVQHDPSMASHIGESHPLMLDRIGFRSVAALRSSDFLFARKFNDSQGDDHSSALYKYLVD